MTVDGLVGERPGGDTNPPNSNLEHTLALCDQVLGEVGRRGHLFTWLRAPEQGTDGWLPVDAYYPRGRLVVRYCARPTPHDELYRELVPARGLRLLELTPSDLGSTPAGAKRALAQKLTELPPAGDSEPPAVPRAPRARANPLRRRPPDSVPPNPIVPTLSAVERGSRFVTARRGAQPARPPESPMLGIVIGLALVLVLIVAVLYITSA
jgi:hypothetical protein